MQWIWGISITADRASKRCFGCRESALIIQRNRNFDAAREVYLLNEALFPRNTREEIEKWTLELQPWIKLKCSIILLYLHIFNFFKINSLKMVFGKVDDKKWFPKSLFYKFPKINSFWGFFSFLGIPKFGLQIWEFFPNLGIPKFHFPKNGPFLGR